MRRVGIEALTELGLTSLAEQWLRSKLAGVEGGVRGQISVRWGDPGPELVSYAQGHAALLDYASELRVTTEDAAVIVDVTASVP